MTDLTDAVDWQLELTPEGEAYMAHLTATVGKRIERLVRLRTALGLSQAEVAKALGGERDPELSELDYMQLIADTKQAVVQVWVVTPGGQRTQIHPEGY